MTTTLKIFPALACAAFMAVALSAPADARHDTRNKSRTPAFAQYHVQGVYGGNYYNYRFFRKHRKLFADWRPYFGPMAGHHAQPHHIGYAKDIYCHPVVRYQRQRGPDALVGATMCYRGHGYGFVIPHSRHVIHWYR